MRAQKRAPQAVETQLGVLFLHFKEKTWGDIPPEKYMGNSQKRRAAGEAAARLKRILQGGCACRQVCRREEVIAAPTGKSFLFILKKAFLQK